jgi:hypothetical protein
LQLVAIENRWMRQEDTWFDAVPPVEVITLGRRSTDPTVLLRVLDAVRKKLEIDIKYASLTGSVQQSRTIAPHSLAHSAGRWYVRSWSREHKRLFHCGIAASPGDGLARPEVLVAGLRNASFPQPFWEHC